MERNSRNRKSRRRRKNNKVTVLLIITLILILAIAAVVYFKPSLDSFKLAETTEAPTTEETTEAPTTVPETTTEPETTPETTEETTPEETTTEAEKKLYTITDVNVRKEPSAEAEILAKLPENTEFTDAKEYDETWTEIVYEGETGYVVTEYLTDDKDWKKNMTSKNGYNDEAKVTLDPEWKYADYSEINSGNAVMYLAKTGRKNIIVGVNAGHGTKGGSDKTTYSHPDKTGKVTGGTNAYGAVKSMCVSSGMTFEDGTPESEVTLKEAQMLKDLLLNDGYDVLMIRDGEDVQLDNVARTVICNNAADCHIAIHWDSDGLNYDKGCFFMAVPDPLKKMAPVSSTWEKSEELGQCLIDGLKANKVKIFTKGTMDMDLTQTSYSSVPSVDIELGNQSSKIDDESLNTLAVSMLSGINTYFGFNVVEEE